MPRIYKGNDTTLRLLIHTCTYEGTISDLKISLYTNDPSIAIEFTDRYTIDGNIVSLDIPNWAFGSMEDGVINYVAQGMIGDDTFLTNRQSNYYLKTPTNFTPIPMPEDVVLGGFTTTIVENGVFEYIPTDVDAWNKATIEVNVPDTNGSFDEGYDKGKNDGYDSGYQDGYNAGQNDCPDCPEGGSCNLIKESFSIKGDYEQFTASEYGADGFESVTIDAYDYGKQKFEEGYEEGKNQGGTATTYPTIKDIYNTEDVTTEVNFKGTVAVCLQGSSSYYMVVTDHTGAIYVTAKQPYDVGDECFLAGVVRKTNSTNMRYMSNPIIEVLSKGNYVVMPTDAVELTNKDELYVPNEYGNAEMKYLYYQGEVQNIASNGNITIITPESVSAEGQITLRAAKEEWRSNLVIGDYIRMYMFTTNGDGFFLPTDIIKLGTEGGSCNLEDKWVTPSMGERDDNGYIVVDQSEGYDGLDRVVIDPTTIYNEGYNVGVEEGRNQGGGSGDCNIQGNKTVELDGYRMGIYPDEGYDGMLEVIVEAGRKAEEWREEGKNDVRNELQTIEITENGRYSADDTELIDYIEFDGNSYFDTNIPFGENTKIEVAITKTTYEEDEQFIGVAQFDLNTAEIYGGFGIVAGAGLAFGVFGQAKTDNIGFSYEKEQILTLDRNGLNSSLTGGGSWFDESGLVYDGLYGQTIGIGKIKSVSDGWIYRGLNGRIRYVKIWTDGNDDSTLVTFIPKNMAQGGFGLVNSDGIEYANISNLGEGTTTFISEWERKYGEGWKEINVNIPTIQNSLKDYYYCPLILGDSGFGEAAKNWSTNMVTFNNYDGGIIEDKLYVPTSNNKNEFRTKEKAKTVQRLPNDVSVLGSMEFGAGVEHFVTSEGKQFTNLTDLTIGPDMNYVDFGPSTFPNLRRIWCFSETDKIDVYFSMGSYFYDSGTLYLKNHNQESKWRNSLPSGWTIVLL